MLDQRAQDQTTHLNDKYERLTANYEELHRLVMEIRSQMGGSRAPPNWLYGPRDYQPPSSHLVPPLL
jgi:hypothetical protein